MRNLTVENFKEIPGIGVSGLIDQQYYEINREGVFENAKKLASFKMADTLRPDSKETLKSLLKHGVSLERF